MTQSVAVALAKSCIASDNEKYYCVTGPLGKDFDDEE